MATELNIVSRGLIKTEWDSSQGGITPEQIADITEQNTENSGALNALPTPFARMYVFADAFRRVKEQGDNAGLAYRRLVSDCLDLFEMIFNWEYHKNKKDNLIIKCWNVKEQLEVLSKTSPIIGKALGLYMDDNAFKGMEEIAMVVYTNSKGKEFVLGGASPLTFFTTPSLDKRKDGSFLNKNYQEEVEIKKQKDKTYFKNAVLLDKRSDKFKKYLYDIFNGHKGSHCSELRDYVLDACANIDQNKPLSKKTVLTLENKRLCINNVELEALDDVSIQDTLLDHLIKVNYRIDDTKFVCGRFENGDPKREYDYLLPISKTVLESVDFSGVNVIFHEAPNQVTVELHYQGHDFKKIYEKYSTDSPGAGNPRGRLVDLKDDYNLQLNLSIYPFLHANDDKYNDYFKVGAYFMESSDRLTVENKNVDCTFFKLENGEYQELRVQDDANELIHGVKKCYRSKLSNDGVHLGSNYFEVFKTKFDLIQLTIKVDQQELSGVIIPKFNKCDVGTSKFNVAVDFGTTNTFIATTKVGASRTPDAFTISENHRQMVMLHKPSGGSEMSPVDRYEKTTFAESRDLIRCEFVPPFIGNQKSDFYHFPIRSALTVNKEMPLRPSLFDHANISFAYEKAPVVSWHTVDTDLKWNKEQIEKVRLFIRELLYLLRTKILMEQGDPSITRLRWFRPLSFTDNQRNLYQKIWKEETELVLHISAGELTSLSESDAPYYYYKENGEVKNISSVAVIDIGGGSTDYVIFEDDQPLIATSINFGCNVLWGNGFNKFKDARDNGLFKAAMDLIKDHVKNLPFSQLNNTFVNDPHATTADILNFWLANDKITGVKNILEESKFKPLYLYHYCAVIYHLAQVMKANGKNHPKSIIFSGNGSRYLDLLASKILLKKIADYIVKWVYREGLSDLQVILPENRKESTAFGGLYNEGRQEATSVHYLGVPLSQAGIYDDKIQSVKHSYEKGQLKRDVLTNVTDFIDCFIQLIKEYSLTKEFEWNFDVEDLRSQLESSSEESLHKAYHDRVAPLNDYEVLNDSMFFYPLIEQLFELSKGEVVARPSKAVKCYYFKLFSELDTLSNTANKPDSVYRIEELENGKGLLRLEMGAVAKKTAFSNVEDIIKPLCEFTNGYPVANCTEYEEVKPGKLARTSSGWKMENKLEIKFK